MMEKVKPYRSELCACGGSIKVVVGEDPTEGVTDHNMTERHRLWRGTPERVEMNKPLLASTDMVSAARVLLAGATCQGCRATVDVIRYGGIIYSLHPNRSLACTARMGQH